MNKPFSMSDDQWAYEQQTPQSPYYNPGAMAAQPGAAPMAANSVAPNNGPDYSGAPPYAAFNPIYNNAMAVGMNGASQKGFEAAANQKGPSAWATLMNQQQNNEETMARDKAAKNAAAGIAQGESGLASSGGLTGGARERLAEGGANAYTAAAQNAAQQGSMNRMQVGINDEQNKLQNMGTAAGMENTNALANLSAQMKGAGSQNEYNLGLYNAQAGAWGADKQAQATQNSGGGSYFCTALKSKGLISTREAALLLRLMQRQAFKRADAVLWYLAHAPKAVELVQDWNTVADLLGKEVLLEMIMHGDEAAGDMYSWRAIKIIETTLQIKAPKFGGFKAWLAIPRLFMAEEVQGWLSDYWSKFSFRRALT